MTRPNTRISEGRTDATFTLIELLTVVSIIAILVALLLPALARAKFQARHAVCASNQKQLSVSMLQYATDNDTYYANPKRAGFVYEEYYPIAAAWSSWQVKDWYSKNSWADYVEGPFGDYRDLTVRHNGIAVCPQGAIEVPWSTEDDDLYTHRKEKAFYTFFTYLGIGQSPDPQISKRLMKRRVGNPFRDKRGTKYYRFSDAPLISDHCQGVAGYSYSGFGHTGTYKFSTNHIWGGDRYSEKNPNDGKTDAHMSAVPVYWGSITGKGEANFGMEDGSVRRFSGLDYFTQTSLMYTANGGVRAADAPLIPLELMD